MNIHDIWRIYWPAWTPQTILAGVVFGFMFGVPLFYRTITGKLKPIQFVSGMMLYVWLYWVYASTVFCRMNHGEYNYNLKLFWSYAFIKEYPGSSMVQEVLLNLIMLFPVGVLFPVALDCRKLSFTALFGLACTAGIETLQLVFQRGLFEWDDMLHNLIGVIAGYLVVAGARKLTDIMPGCGTKRKLKIVRKNSDRAA